MEILDGENPNQVHCRVCGSWCIPPYPGYQKDAVCSKDCFNEFKWRETLGIMRSSYHKQKAD